MKTLITGVCGFVGSSVAAAIRESRPDWDLVGIDNLSRPGSWLNRSRVKDELEINLFHGDIRVPSDIDALPKCDLVIDAAAIPAVGAGMDGKTNSRQLIEHNLNGTINLLEYCRKYSATFSLISTSRVYAIRPLAELDLFKPAEDEFECTPPLGALDRFHVRPRQKMPRGLSPLGITEGFSTKPPVSLYGSTKVASEQLALEYGEAYDFPVWINRCGVMAGAGQFGQPAQGIISYWIHSFRERRSLKYIGFDGHGRQVRDCLHPRDLVVLILKQLEKGPFDTRIFNAAGGLQNSFSLSELTSWCSQRVPSEETFKSLGDSAAGEGRVFDLPWVVLDSSNAESEFGWQPSTTIDQVCEEIASFADTHPAWLEISMN